MLETKTQIEKIEARKHLDTFSVQPLPHPIPQKKQYQSSVQSMIVQDQDHFFACFPPVEKPLSRMHVSSQGDQLTRTKNDFAAADSHHFDQIYCSNPRQVNQI